MVAGTFLSKEFYVITKICHKPLRHMEDIHAFASLGVKRACWRWDISLWKKKTENKNLLRAQNEKSGLIGDIRAHPLGNENIWRKFIDNPLGEIWSLESGRREGESADAEATSRIERSKSASQVLMKCTYPWMETSPAWLAHVLTIWREPCRKGEDVSLTLDWAFWNVLGAIVWARLANGLLIQTHASSPSLPVFYCLTPPLNREAFHIQTGSDVFLLVSFAASLYYTEIKERC